MPTVTMRFTGELSILPEHPTLTGDQQAEIIFEIAAEVGVPAAFLGSIRKTEAGGPGREFGVLSQPAETFHAQARVCALSIRNNMFRFIDARHAWPVGHDGALSEDFIQFMGARWAPRDVANDPHDLNQYWVKNVSTFYRQSGVVV